MCNITLLKNRLEQRHELLQDSCVFTILPKKYLFSSEQCYPFSEFTVKIAKTTGDTFLILMMN